MSAAVTFTLLPIDRLEAACAAAEAGTLALFLKREGKTAAQFAGDGGIYGAVFAYLDEERGINVSSSEHDELTARLSEATNGSCYLLTADHRAAHYDALDPARIPKDELQEYYEEYNESDEPGAGGKMWSAIRALRESLSRVDATRVTLLAIG
ncbi:MAG: hypothetical protein IPJ77_06545 [Planctomycetes bacterium]|nr:hypothetical protein [Planctomycetota bacterium]